MISVLYVDDEHELCELAQLFLSELGFSVDVFTSAQEALASPRLRSYDAIVSDYQMPVLDGIGFLQTIRKTGEDIPFILFTGRGREEIVIQAINYGADFYLQKGGDPTAQFAELAHKIRISVERRKALAALKDSEQRLNDIINFLPDATFAIDRAGTVIAWNKAIEEMTGVPAAQMLGKGNNEYAVPFYGTRRKILIDLIFEPDDLIAKNYAHIIHDKGLLIAETSIPRPLGRTVTLLGKASPLYNRQGEMVGAIESIRDITELRRAEGELRAAYEQMTATNEELQGQYEELASSQLRLRESEEKYRELAELLPQIVFEIDTSYNLTFANRHALASFGYTEQDAASGINVLDVIDPEQHDLVQANAEKLLMGKFVGSQEYRAIRRDGSDFPILIYSAPLFRAGILAGFRGVAVDISDHKRAEEDLRQREAVLSSIFRVAPIGISLEVNRVIFRVNDWICDMTGYTAEELVGKNARILYPSDEDYEFVDREQFDQIRKYGTGTVDARWKRKDGVIRDILLSSTPIDPQDHGKGITFTALDITERKELVDQLQMVKTSVDRAYDEIFWMDFTGNILYVNESACRLNGYTPEEFQSLTIFGLNPNLTPEIWQMSVADLRQRKTQIITTRHRNKDGHIRDVELVASYVNKEGKEYSFAFVRDITERKRMEQEIAANQLQLTNLMQNLPVGIFRTTVERPGRRIMANPDLARIFGYDSVGEFMESSLEESYADPDTRTMIIDRLAREGIIRNAEVQFRKKGGELFWASISAVLVPAKDGSPAFLDGLITDITEQKRQASVIRIQLDLGLTVQNLHTLDETLTACLDAGIRIAGMDAGGIYLVDRETGALDLKVAKNLGNAFLGEISHYSADSHNTRIVMAGRPRYLSYMDSGMVHTDIQRNEGLHAIAILPITFNSKVIACMNIASHLHDTIPATARIALETIATQIGAAIGRIRGEEELSNQYLKLTAAQDELRRGREQFDEITATLPGVVYQFYTRPDGSMGLYYVSSRVTEVFGMSGDLNTFFERFTACVDPRDREAFLASISWVVKEGTPWLFEGRFMHPSRGEIWFEGKSRPVRHGDELVFSGTLSDITERKQAEQALFESREKYRIMIETASEGIWVIDDQFRTTFTNQRMLEIFGYTAEEMLGSPVWDFVPPGESESMKSALHERRAGKPARYERTWVRKDGTIVWCLTSGTPLFAKDGTFAGSFGLFTDITERWKSETALRESEERLQLALDGGELGTWYWNVQTGVVTFNERWAAMLGYDLTEIEPHVKTWERLVHPDDMPRVQEILNAHLEGKTAVYECEHRLLHKNSSWIWVLDKGKVIRRDAAGIPLFAAGTHLDITRRKQAEEALAGANRKTKLLNSMTRHDILNQLLALRGFAQVAAKNTIDPALAAHLAKILSISETMTNQIEFTRIYQELGIKGPVWLQLEDVITRTTGSIPVRHDGSCRGIEIFSDPLFEKVFFNLFENASRHGKEVTGIRVSCEPEGNALRIIVEDNGTGIPAQDKERIFERGFGKNTGLGLFLSKEILGITGISIRETGISGTGARFELVVPAGFFRKGTSA